LEFNQKIKILDEKAEKICTELARILILNKKNLMEIDLDDNGPQTQFNSLMKDLQGKEDLFINALTRALMEIKDEHSYGAKIVKDYKVFENYNDIQRKELTKTQDIEYVLENLAYTCEISISKKILPHEKSDIRKVFNAFNEIF
jgi:hypothetical protein